MALPPRIKKYFWDADIDQSDFKKHAPYVIERILEYGDESAVRWLFQTFPGSLIKKTLMTRRGFSPQSANFWAFILKVPKSKVLCLKKPFRGRRLKHWIW